jgi:Protein of unknown function (DUF4232)
MSDLERSLRDARASLPEPEPFATERTRAAVLATVSQRSRLPTRRLAIAAVVAAAALAGAFAAGLAVAPGGATTEADGPGFLPARGWDTFQTGVTEPPRAVSATAANVALRSDALAGSFPWPVIAGLRAGQVLLQATFYPRGESASTDRRFTPRTLPLSLADATPGASLEGQPPNVSAYRLVARVNNYNLDLFVFFGGRPTDAALAAAQEELDRLVVPESAPGPLVRRPAGKPSRTACRPSGLRATVSLQGATGSLLGGIRLRNAGSKTCTLRGRPLVELRDANGVLLDARERAVPPQWKQLGAPRPPGWPTVRLAPRGKAQVFVQLRNWCVVPARAVFFHVYLPGAGERVVAPARITLRCDAPQQPVELAIGPVEPVP